MKPAREDDRNVDGSLDSASLKRNVGGRAKRGAAVTIASNGFRFLLEAMRIVVLARLLQPADYGLVAMVLAVTGFIDLFKDLGLNMATVTRERLSQAQLSNLFWLNAVFGIGLTAITVASAPLLAWFYGDARLTSITMVIACTFMLAGLAVQHQALLRRHMRFGTLAVIRILEVLVGLVVGIAVAWLGGGYWALVAMPIASALVNLFGVWSQSGWRPHAPVRGVGTLEMVQFGSQVLGQNAVAYFSRRLDQLMLGWWSGPVALGLYTKANSVVEAPLKRALGPAATVVIPSLSRLAAEPERYAAAYLRILRLLCLVLMPMAATMIATAPWAIPWLLGDQWVDAVPLFSVLALLGFVRPLELSNWWVFVTQNRAAQGLRVSTWSALITCVAVVIGVRWGALGVASAIAISAFLRTPIIVWYMARCSPVRAGDVYRVLLAPALAALASWLAMAAAIRFADGHPASVVLAAALAITGAVTGAVLTALPSGREALQDLWSVAQMLRPRLRAANR